MLVLGVKIYLVYFSLTIIYYHMLLCKPLSAVRVSGGIIMKVKVSLDRVTVTGEAHYSVGLMDLARHEGWVIKTGPNGVYASLDRLFDNDYTEVMAVLVSNPYREDSWRVDTSNHLNDDELRRVRAVSSRLIESHITRVDVAFDFINGFYEPMKHVIVRPRATQTEIYETEYRDASRRLQTLYSGRRSSNKMYRLYDKLVEQKKHGVAVPNNVERWERWEMQLRGKGTHGWVRSAHEMLSQIKYPSYQDLSPTDIGVLHAIDDGLISFKDFSKAKAARLRKLRSIGVGYKDDYARLAEAELINSIDRINNEVSQFLKEL